MLNLVWRGGGGGSSAALPGYGAPRTPVRRQVGAGAVAFTAGRGAGRAVGFMNGGSGAECTLLKEQLDEQRLPASCPRDAAAASRRSGYVSGEEVSCPPPPLPQDWAHSSGFVQVTSG